MSDLSEKLCYICGINISEQSEERTHLKLKHMCVLKKIVEVEKSEKYTCQEPVSDRSLKCRVIKHEQ